VKLSFSYDWLEAFELLTPAIRKQIFSKLKEIDRAHSWPHEALKGRQFKGLYKFRVGDYRLIYRIVEGKTLDFLYLGHRREIYK